MGIDKIKSCYQCWRISEKTLWTLAIFGGALGILLGMKFPLYHKAKKDVFKIGIPVILLFWILLLTYLWQK